MSKGPAQKAVVEWSPSHVSWVGTNHELVTVASLEEAAGQLPSREIVVAVSRRSAFVRPYRVPNTGKAELRRILEMQIGKIFPIPPSELAFDFHLTHDVGAEGRLAIIAAMRSADLLSMHQQAKSAGLKISQVTLAALGSPLVAKGVGLDSAAVVHRTAEGLAIDLVAGGELRYSRVAAAPATSIAIDAEVSRTFAAAVMSCVPTVAAGGLLLPDAEASTNVWSLETLAGTHVDIDIETSEQILSRERRGQTARLQSSVAVLIVGLAISGFQYSRWSKAATAYNQQAGIWAKESSDLNKKLKLSISDRDALLNVQKALDTAFHPAQQFSDIISVASNDVTAGIWLTGFSLERGKPLTIRGSALGSQTVVNYQNARRGEDRFRDVKLIGTSDTLVQNTPIVQFSISAFPIGNLPLAEPTKKKAGAGQ
ncbi:MAG TPA: hypothetical protein VMI31_14605 [Fimbriimonadaceae bacterium]|nr:hypothetical protein [Fimbriimonadaceae bacterium]